MGGAGLRRDDGCIGGAGFIHKKIDKLLSNVSRDEVHRGAVLEALGIDSETTKGDPELEQNLILKRLGREAQIPNKEPDAPSATKEDSADSSSSFWKSMSNLKNPFTSKKS